MQEVPDGAERTAGLASVRLQAARAGVGGGGRRVVVSAERRTTAPRRPPRRFAIVEDAVRRPALRVRDGTFDPGESESWKDPLDGARPLLEAALPSVGRLELEDGRSAGGTAWMVARGVAVTAGHVVRGLPRGWATTDCRVDFRREFRSEDSAIFAVERIVCGRWGADVAFLGLSGRSLDGSIVAPPPLALDDAKEPGVAVALIGYPVTPGDDACRPAEVASLLGGVDGVKRLQPGLIVRVEPPRFYHDASTSDDSSGSPAVDLATGRVVGMHTDGSCTERTNWGVRSESIGRLLGELFDR